MMERSHGAGLKRGPGEFQKKDCPDFGDLISPCAANNRAGMTLAQALAHVDLFPATRRQCHFYWDVN